MVARMSNGPLCLTHLFLCESFLLEKNLERNLSGLIFLLDFSR